MDQFTELFGCRSEDTLRFFFGHLQEIVPDPNLTQEKIYGASILGHFAQVSRFDREFMVFTNLSEVFDCVMGELPDDAIILENTGANILFLAGFFQDQLKARHNIRWYYGLGEACYARAERAELSAVKKVLFSKIARNFSFWGETFCRMHREIRDDKYLLRFQ